ncbi:MAG: hypothetical protein V1872_08685, partial [bacterium]
MSNTTDLCIYLIFIFLMITTACQKKSMDYHYQIIKFKNNYNQILYKKGWKELVTYSNSILNYYNDIHKSYISISIEQ